LIDGSRAFAGDAALLNSATAYYLEKSFADPGYVADLSVVHHWTGGVVQAGIPVFAPKIPEWWALWTIC
jgi:hypothetical protein